MRALLLVLLAGVAACRPAGDAPDVPPAAAPPAADAAPPLVGTEWRLAAVDGAAPATLAGGDALVTVAFTRRPFADLDPDAWSLGGYDGCNDFGQAYRLAGDPAAGATFRAGIVASNAMACGAPGTHVSDRLHAGLAAARRLRVADGRLVLADSLGAELLAFVPRPVRAVDRPALRAGRWRLDPAASTVRNASGGPAGRYDVAFATDTTYAGRAGCVAFAGTYRLDGDRLFVTSYDRDDRACPAADRFWDGPNGLDTGEVEATPDRLVIHGRTGRRAVFVR